MTKQEYYNAVETNYTMVPFENAWELYEKLQAENERLKAELKQTEAQDQVVIDGLRKENRKTLHALWMARAERAHTETLFYFNLSIDGLCVE